MKGELTDTETFASLLSWCASVDGGTPSGTLIGVWAVTETDREQCDIGCCRSARSVMLVYTQKMEIYVLFLCRDHAVEMARPKDGDLLEEFTYRVLGEKTRRVLAKAGKRPSESKTLRAYGLTTPAGTLTRLGREVLARADS